MKLLFSEGRFAQRCATRDAQWLQWLLILGSVGFIVLFLGLPLLIIFYEALHKGWQTYLHTFSDETVWQSILLTITITSIVVPLNATLGLTAAWLVTRFQFRGREILTSLIELPLWVSPVIAGLVCILLWGTHGWFGKILKTSDVKIIFALPGMILTTLFVTFSFVARCIIPQMQSQGHHEEEAAMTLGSSGWRTFFTISIPKIKWSLIYGIILCCARSMGEFGAVSVVSGHIRGKTITMPLQIEILYNEYHFTESFALASVLSLFALVTLLIKVWIESHADIKNCS
jgi:sulfate transport system permease protein